MVRYSLTGVVASESPNLHKNTIQPNRDTCAAQLKEKRTDK